MSEKHSGNFRIMDASGITQSMVGVRYNEDGSPISGVVFGVNTVSDLKIYHANQVVLLPSNYKEVWSPQSPPATGLLCVHTEDYPLGEADNVLADAERLRRKIFDEIRGGVPVEEVEQPPQHVPGTRPHTSVTAPVSGTSATQPFKIAASFILSNQSTGRTCKSRTSSFRPTITSCLARPERTN
jgi:hypothetical protein